MIDHRPEMTADERARGERYKRDITALVEGNRRTGISTEERRRRRAKRKRQAAARRTGRS